MDTSFITINTHSSIRLETKLGTVIYVDPFGFTTEPHDADMIMITHIHFDHFSPEDIARVRTPFTKFVMPAQNMLDFIKAGFTGEHAVFLVPYERAMPLPGIEIETVPAYNISKKFHSTDCASTLPVTPTTCPRIVRSSATSRSCPWVAPTPWTPLRRRPSSTP